MVKSEAETTLERLQKRIRSAAQGAGRNPREISLVAVSKSQSSASVRKFFEAGQVAFAENYQQEALGKQKELADLEIDWHFIGKIQGNKVNHLVGAFSLLHSVDRWEIARKIDERAAKINFIQPILIEVNVAKEASKAGVSESELSKFVSRLLTLSHVRLSGLMVMPPLFKEAEEARPYFRRARELLQEVRATVIQNPQRQAEFKHLSMGTSSDYAVAIQEGATMVRLGTVLFGSRSPKITKENG